ncbi:hypothetical protein Psch_02019 [Pelotomaculum schinkii]|uniref:Uncharacterized protein n=1 Tax=Pelotomaculum schinkii TaxID=78350 RepID=A0A4Y7RI17_9FIRM|nr:MULTISPECIES: hypothetical protein [Pelotomaculum]TEB08456.1 hypothetical protein Psch_02019 [Pelotomaculum schinkii]TEB17171.1 hypothetical protein Psfp_00675 [Pelotomaculum sp. FP]
MTEGGAGPGALEDSVVRILEHQTKYGIDQDTMLIYLSSVNLMSILNLLNRRYGGSAGIAPATLPLPPLMAGTPQAGGPPLENMLGALLKMLGSQSNGDSTGQGINPATLLNMLAALSQNVDLGKMMGMLSGLMCPPGKTAASQQQDTAGPSCGSELGPAKPGFKEIDKSREDGGEKREVPKIMKWDQLK